MRMNRFINAIMTEDTRTENGMPTHSTSGDAVLDMFFKMGGSRGMGENAINDMFERALSEDTILAIMALFHNRNIRGGQGERRSFRVMFKDLCLNHPYDAIAVAKFVPVYGRWDDLLVALGTPVQNEAVRLIRKGLVDNNVLCKKWMPREGKAQKRLADALRKALGLSWKEYRRAIATDRETVENFMCSGAWDEINYSHVPSVASKNYRQAFGRHDADRYGDYLARLTKGDKSVKVNASAIFPHTIVREFLNAYGRVSNAELLEAQWKALPDYVAEGMSFLPIVDVSGSMRGEPLEVAVALGIYLSQRNKSSFKNAFITFSRSPSLQYLTQSKLADKVRELSRAEWDMNTDLQAAFRLILSKAVAARLPQEDMPTTVIILSDMQFDEAIRDGDVTAMNMIKNDYARAGYEAPSVVFWNLRTSNGVPVKFNEQGVCLVSGFSPSTMKAIVGGDFTPESIMMKTLAQYEQVREALLAKPF